MRVGINAENFSVDLRFFTDELYKPDERATLSIEDLKSRQIITNDEGWFQATTCEQNTLLKGYFEVEQGTGAKKKDTLRWTIRSPLKLLLNRDQGIYTNVSKFLTASPKPYKFMKTF